MDRVGQGLVEVVSIPATLQTDTTLPILWMRTSPSCSRRNCRAAKFAALTNGSHGCKRMKENTMWHKDFLYQQKAWRRCTQSCTRAKAKEIGRTKAGKTKEKVVEHLEARDSEHLEARDSERHPRVKARGRTRTRTGNSSGSAKSVTKKDTWRAIAPILH